MAMGLTSTSNIIILTIICAPVTCFDLLDRDDSAHVAVPTLPSQVDVRCESTKHGAEKGGDGEKLLQELDALFQDAQDKASDDGCTYCGPDDDDDLPPEEEHDDDCDCGFCGPCGAWAWARGEHPRQRAEF